MDLSMTSSRGISRSNSAKMTGAPAKLCGRQNHRDLRPARSRRTTPARHHRSDHASKLFEVSLFIDSFGILKNNVCAASPRIFTRAQPLRGLKSKGLIVVSSVPRIVQVRESILVAFFALASGLLNLVGISHAMAGMLTLYGIRFSIRTWPGNVVSRIFAVSSGSRSKISPTCFPEKITLEFSAMAVETL